MPYSRKSSKPEITPCVFSPIRTKVVTFLKLKGTALDSPRRLFKTDEEPLPGYVKGKIYEYDLDYEEINEKRLAYERIINSIEINRLKISQQKSILDSCLKHMYAMIDSELFELSTREKNIIYGELLNLIGYLLERHDEDKEKALQKQIFYFSIRGLPKDERIKLILNFIDQRNKELSVSLPDIGINDMDELGEIFFEFKEKNKETFAKHTSKFKPFRTGLTRSVKLLDRLEKLICHYIEYSSKLK